MHVSVNVGDVHPETVSASPVDFRWDPDTDILTAHVRQVATGTGMSGSVEIEGSDGSWLILEVKGGQVAGIEVAVWPDVKKTGSLVPPADAVHAAVSIPARGSQPGVASLEVDTQLTAQADAAERTIHFRLGNPRVVSVVRVAADLLLELDERRHLVGVWMLNVPPFPSDQ